MLFNSYIFILLFLPLTLFLFFITAKFNRHVALFTLFFASLIFYGWSDYRCVMLLIFSISLNFIIGKWIIGSNSIHFKKWYLYSGLVFNLGLLFYFKYANFFIQNTNVFFQSLSSFPLKFFRVAFFILALPLADQLTRSRC